MQKLLIPNMFFRFTSEMIIYKCHVEEMSKYYGCHVRYDNLKDLVS